MIGLRGTRAKIIAGLLVLAVGWWAYSKWRKPAATTPQFQTAQAQKETLIVSVTASGTVSTANSVPVGTQASGVISKLYVQNGQQVKAGDAVAEIDLDQSSMQKYLAASASYQSAKNSVDSAKNNLYTLQAAEFAANQKFINDAVARNLATNDPTYIQQNATWLAAQNAYTNQQNIINQAQTALSGAWYSYIQTSPTVYAPISGKINGLSVQTGSVIAGTSSSSSNTSSVNKIASIVTNATPTITVNLTEIDVTKVKAGNRATITLDALTGKTFTGKVISIDTSGSVTSGVTSYPTIIQLDNSADEIYPNMSATASIITQTKDNALVVPAAAVQTTNGQSTVRIMKNGSVQSATVETGLASSTQIEVTSGLNPGDTVVTSTATNNAAGQSRSGQTISPFSGFGGGGFRVGR